MQMNQKLSNEKLRERVMMLAQFPENDYNHQVQWLCCASPHTRHYYAYTLTARTVNKPVAIKTNAKYEQKNKK